MLSLKFAVAFSNPAANAIVKMLCDSILILSQNCAGVNVRFHLTQKCDILL